MTETDPQHRILAAVDAAFDTQLATTAEMVRCPSTRGQEREVQERMASLLGGLGYKVDHWRLPERELRAHSAYMPLMRDLDQAFNTVGTLPCRSPVGRSLILNGHVDVVPTGPADMWTHPPFEPVIEYGWMYGRGAGDMKSGLIAGVYAIEAIRQAGFRPGAEIILQSVIEEESTGAGALACVTRGYEADLALVPEPFWETMVRAQLGVVWGRLRLLGRPDHAAYAQRGSNAIDAGIRMIEALRKLETRLNAPERRHPLYADAEHPINLNIGGIRGGEWPSSVPCTCEVDIRCALFPGEDPADLQAALAATVAEAAEADSFLRTHPPQLDWTGFLSPGYVLEGAEDAEARFTAAHARITGTPLEFTAATALTDARFFGLYQDTPALVYGAAAEGVHGFNERVDLDSLRRVTKTMALFIADWCGLIADDDA